MGNHFGRNNELINDTNAVDKEETELSDFNRNETGERAFENQRFCSIETDGPYGELRRNLLHITRREVEMYMRSSDMSELYNKTEALKRGQPLKTKLRKGFTGKLKNIFNKFKNFFCRFKN
ncbi:uncharacterized protein LOC134262087 [Saccostrea cucullata]|uniref:uncharacterized protein LOC134262087 n=1 Tax=Saccostrea cuccullata TaxID=36930 RepID=UPI002ED53EB7